MNYKGWLNSFLASSIKKVDLAIESTIALQGLEVCLQVPCFRRRL